MRLGYCSVTAPNPSTVASSTHAIARAFQLHPCRYRAIRANPCEAAARWKLEPWKLDGTYAVQVRDESGDHWVTVQVLDVRGSTVAVDGIVDGTEVLVPA